MTPSRTYLAGRFADRLSTTAAQVTALWIGAQHGIQVAGAVLVLMTLTRFALGLPAGAWVDRRTFMGVTVITCSLRICLVAVFAFLATSVSGSWTVLAFVVSLSAVAAFHDPAMEAAAAHLAHASDDSAARMMSAATALDRIATITTPAVAGAAIVIGVVPALVAVAVLTLVSLLAFTRVRIGASVPQTEPILSSIRSGLRVVLADRSRRFILAVFLLANVWIAPLLLAAPLLAAKHHWGSVTFGLVLSGAAVGGVVGSLILASTVRRITDKVRTALALLGLGSLVLMTIGLTENPWLVGLCLAAGSLLVTPSATLLVGTLFDSVPDEAAGRLSSIIDVAAGGLAPLAAAVFTVAAAEYGVRLVSVWFFAGLLATALIAGASRSARFAQQRLEPKIQQPVD